MFINQIVQINQAHRNYLMGLCDSSCVVLALFYSNKLKKPMAISHALAIHIVISHYVFGTYLKESFIQPLIIYWG